MDAQGTQAQPTAQDDWKAQAVELRKQGIGLTEIAKRLNKPLGTVSPYLSRLSINRQVFQLGTLQGAQSNEGGKAKDGGIGPPPQPSRAASEEEKARVGALRLLNRVRRGVAGISKDRITAATTILGKIKAASEDDAASKTVYSTMGDEELAEHVVTSAAASIGVVKLREVLDRLQREGTLIKSPGEHGAEAAGLGGVVQGAA